jgi:CRISPR/Cas system CMR subunit Cmr6 (Cas7 group RAMP superfamily)
MSEANQRFDSFSEIYMRKLNGNILKNKIREIWEGIWENRAIPLKNKKKEFKEKFMGYIIKEILRDISYFLKFKVLKIYEVLEDDLKNFAKTLRKTEDHKKYEPEIPSAKEIYKEIMVTNNNRRVIQPELTMSYNMLNDVICWTNTIPKYSCLIEVHFKLKKPYLSKDDDDFYIIDNPIVKDKVFKLPMVRSTTWKGALRFATKLVCEDENIIIRLFGNEKEETKNFRQGRLFFYPTFFDSISLDVITPLSRETKTPVRGPIYFEIVPENTTGVFRLLYYPFDLVAKGEFNKIEKEAKEDFEIVAKTIHKVFYEIGFSAKKSSGFGTAEVEEIKIDVGGAFSDGKEELKERFEKVDEFKGKTEVNTK